MTSPSNPLRAAQPRAAAQPQPAWAYGTVVLGVLAALAGALPGSAAAATVLDFENLTAEGALPAGYAGLDWSTGGWTAFALEQAPYTAHSGQWRLATGFGADDAASEIRFNTPTVFDGAWFAGLAGASVSFQLFAGGQMVASSALLDPSATPAFLASGYAGWVDAVRVGSNAHASFVMDDFSFSAAVPEPGAALLLALGLGALALAQRRRG